MDLDFLEASPRNPARPPDWRWRRAAGLVEYGPAGGDDGWVSRAVAYLTRLRGDVGPDRLAGEEPDVAAAHAVSTSADRLGRGAMEGRLLAGLSDDEVAADSGLTAAAVEAYHALFFDVRERLGARVWVVTHAVGPEHSGGLTEADVDVMLRRAGFLYGPGLVDRLVRYFRGGCRVPARLGGLTRGFL